MAISGKKRQEIIGAIEDLYRTTGQIPTVVGVIEAMGGGSPSYVTPVLREWREALSEREQVIRDMPESVKRVMDEALVAVWSRAVQEADRDLAAYREAAEREKKELLEERNLALSELEKVEAALEQQKIELNGALAQNQALKQANVELEEKAHQAVTELEIRTVEVQSLKDRLDDHKALLTEQKKSSAALEKKLLEVVGRGK